MRMRIVPALISVVLAGGTHLDAAGQTSGFRYPRVYGPTGRPYGPTQAHYQYQRQYGRSWHGEGGNTAQHLPASGLGFYNFGAYPQFLPYGGFGFGFTPIPPGYSPFVYYAPTYVYPDYYGNQAIVEALREEDERWKQPVVIPPAPGAPALPMAPSSRKARDRSIRLERHGDERMRNHEYRIAYDRYRQAASAAKDRAAPRYRMAIALVAQGRYTEAVQQIKRALEISVDLPDSGVSLDEIFGEDARLAVLSLYHRLAAWTREDIRDPDRLFLFGVLLHFDGDERAIPFFETALRLAGRGDHLYAFLRSDLPDEGGPLLEAHGDDGTELPASDDSAENDGIPIPPLPAERSRDSSVSDDGPPLPDPIPQLPSIP